MDTIVKLNVGGKHYMTTRTTLENCGENMLSNLISAKYSPTMIEDAYFIDRDGTTFREILNFLRNAEEYKLPTNSQDLNALLIEARYYTIMPLIEKIEQKLEHRKKIFAVERPLYMGDTTCSHYVCSNAPEKINARIEKCRSEKKHMSVTVIIAMAEEEGFHLIQSVTSAPKASEAFVSLFFQGY